MLREDEGPEAIRNAGDLIAHLHIAEKAKRTCPGTDGDDFTPYFQALADVGYSGGLSMECGWKNLEEQLPVAMEVLRSQLAGIA
jgi:sugar phosphate isomerase/epimerase